MRLPGLRNLLPALLALTIPFLSAAQFSGQSIPASHAPIQADRIAASADFSLRIPLAGHVPTWATPSRDQGAVPASTPVSLTLSLSRSPQLQAAFDQLLLDQQNPSSSRYHQWLTPQQVGEQYGPTQNDLDALTAWLTAQGLHVDSVDPSRIFLHASAPASTVSAVFQTSLHTFTHLSRSLMEPTSEPVIPAALAPVVQYIQGLAQVDYRTHLKPLPILPIGQTNIRPATSAASTGAVQPDITLSNGTIHWIAPADFATLYDVPSTSTGASQKIAVIGGSRLLASDVTSWESISGLASYQPNYIIPPASACGTTSTSACSDPGVTSNGDQAEGTLDFERAYGTAPGATVDQIISTNWLNGTVTYELIQYAINTVNDPILTMSFGACEPEQSAQFLAFENSIFSQAASQGISVFASSGDSGAAGCEASGTPPANQSTMTVAISDVCSSSFVTCVGGTQFSDTASPSTYWSSTNNSTNHGSALSYIPEGAWNEPSYITTSNTTAYSISATGGGVSTFTAKPSFQAGSGVPADGARDVPDISFSASTHNGYFICLAYLGADCTQYLTAFGGTSASAPSMAGVAALLDQKLAARQGNLNPLLYKLAASTPAAFHDATPATSGVSSCSVATASTCNNSDPSATGLTGGTAGYPLTTGYDLSTGLGSLDVNAFLTAAATAPALAATTTTLTAAPTTITTAQTVVFTASVASTTAGTPTGTVTFTSNGSALGSAITLSSGKAVTSALPFTTAGTYSIVASYSGDSVYAASTSTFSLVVATPVLPTTTTTLVGTASSITTQQTVSYTATITSTGSGTPTGTVQFVRTSAGTATNIGSAVAVSGGKATSPAISLAAGTYTITGVYSGDSSFTGSTSAGIPLTVTNGPTTTTISPTSSSVNSITANVFTATVTSSGTPTGTVQFSVDGVVKGAPVALSGSSASSPIFYFTPGTHTVTATYSGDSTFATSTSSAASITSVITNFTANYISSNPSNPVQNVGSVLMAGFSVTTGGPIPTAVPATGVVTFIDTTANKTLGAVVPVLTNGFLTASLNVTFTTSGNHLITTMFSGDTNYAASPVEGPATISVTPAPTYTLTPAATTLTLTSASGQSGTDVITAASTTGYTGSIAFTCAVALTSGATASIPPTCSLSASSITFPGTTSTTVTIGTIAPHVVGNGPVSSLSPRSRILAAGGTLAFAGLLLFGLPLTRRRTNWRALAGILLLAGSLFGLSGCGSSTGGTTATVTPTGGTTTGAYAVTITGTTTTGIAATTTTISLTVN